MKVLVIATSKNEADLYMGGYIPSNEWNFVYEEAQIMGIERTIILLCGQYNKRQDWRRLSQTIKTRRCVIAKVL